MNGYKQCWGNVHWKDRRHEDGWCELENHTTALSETRIKVADWQRTKFGKIQYLFSNN
jgi:hypothetical protein